MFTVPQKTRSLNRVCGLPDKFAGIRLAILYIEGIMSEEEYREMYDCSNLPTRDAMDAVVFDYITSAKVGA